MTHSGLAEQARRSVDRVPAERFSPEVKKGLRDSYPVPSVSSPGNDKPSFGTSIRHRQRPKMEAPNAVNSKQPFLRKTRM